LHLLITGQGRQRLRGFEAEVFGEAAFHRGGESRVNGQWSTVKQMIQRRIACTCRLPSISQADLDPLTVTLDPFDP